MLVVATGLGSREEEAGVLAVWNGPRGLYRTPPQSTVRGGGPVPGWLCTPLLPHGHGCTAEWGGERSRTGPILMLTKGPLHALNASRGDGFCELTDT